MSWWTSIRNTIEDIAPIAAGVFLGPAAGAALGIGATAGSALVGAGAGALSGYAKTGHLGGTLEGAALGGAGGYLAGGGGANILGSLSGGGAAGGMTQDAAGLLGNAPLTDSALGLGTATAPGYVLPSVGAGSGGLLSDLASTYGGDIAGAAKMFGGNNMISGLAQLYQSHLANQNAQQLMQVAQQGNALGPYRQQYAQQLAQLQANPSSIQGTPGYNAAIQAIERQMGARGQLNGGMEAAALGQIGSQLYQQQFQNLYGLAGGNINPFGAGSLIGSAGQSQASGMGLLSSGLSTLGQSLQ